MKRSSLHDIVLDARTNYNKTVRDLLWGHNVTGKEEKLKELIYDARQDRNFDYIQVAEKNGILENKIIIGGGRLDERYRNYKGLTGYKLREFLDSGGVSAPYIPLMKTSFPVISAEELVSVQPISDPCGLIFTTDYRYDTKKIVAKSPRKLKTKWSIESAKDLGTYHGFYDRIDLKSDLMAKEISKEIDKEILDALYKKTVISAGLRQGRRPAKHVEFPEIPF